MELLVGILSFAVISLCFLLYETRQHLIVLQDNQRQFNDAFLKLQAAQDITGE